MKTPSPPPAPDPKATASAQTASNVASATANARLLNSDEYSPLGTVKYDIVDWQTIPDGLGGSTQVPKYSRTQTLSPEQQRLYDQQNELGFKMNDIAGSQLDRLSTTLNEPINFDGAPVAPGDMEAYRQKVQDAMDVRSDAALGRDRSALENRLTAQGLQRGTTAFNDAMDEVNRTGTDARTQNYLASAAESREAAAAQATARERYIQEIMLKRNQPISEISTLMNGGQPTMPQFTPYKASPVSDTPYGQYVYQGYNTQMDGWKAETAAKAQAMNGLFSGLSTMAGGLARMSDRRLKKNIEYKYTLPSGINVYEYEMIWGGERQTGVMAQEVETIIPEAVIDGALFKSVDYSKVF